VTLPSVRLLTAAVTTLLNTPPLVVYPSTVTTPPPVDAAGVVKGYGVLHPGAGMLPADNLTGQPSHLVWYFQVSCVGGNHDYVTWATDLVRSRLDGHTLTVAGAVVGLMQPPFGYTAPPALVDEETPPTRLMIPLQYQVTAVPT
jgi:hypothetical protein